MSHSSREQFTTLEGVLERVTYVNEETAWSVVRVGVPGRREPVTAVGNLLGVQPGENLRMRGAWTVDRRFGEQFRVDSYVTVKPATLVGIEKYLGSGLVPGIGRVMARRLVERFGTETLEVIDRAPERLTEVEGVGPIRSARIAEAWAEQARIREVMVFLQAHGVSTTYAVRIYKRYGDAAVEVVRANPYRLALDITGIGFLSADRIAAQLGISPRSPERARAGVLHVLGEATSEGHVFATREQLRARAAELLGVEPELADEAVAACQRDGEVVIEALPEPEGAQAVFLRWLHGAECGLAERVAAIARRPARPITIDVERALAWYEQRREIALAAEQREAIRRAVDGKLVVVTGGPGTGKTTLVNGILDILERKGRRILLAAPTGRAAKRLAETTGREAKTLHRLLEFDPRAMRFARTRSRPLEADMVVVDEASMLDLPLAHDLLQAIPSAAQLVLVGDIDQLPSVGPGSVLADLIRSGGAAVIRLSHIFRQARESLIVTNAHRVNAGEMPVTPRQGDTADFFFVEKETPEDVLDAVKRLVTERIPRSFALDPLADVQVLTPMHKGILGAANLNAELQSLLNPAGRALMRGTRLLRVGDKVMQTRNNYDLDVFNGDIGRVASIDEVMRTATVSYDDRLVPYTPSDLDELVLAYACSVHKAQGSEYPAVVLPVHTQHAVLLQRNLLYTGITRGRRLVVLVGTRRALGMAIRNARVQARQSLLAPRIAAALRA